MPGPSGLSGRLILADKGYVSGKSVKRAGERGGTVVIPGRITARHPGQTGWFTYKERHLIETLFLKFKNNRRFATRYDKESSLFSGCYFSCPHSRLVTLMVLKHALVPVIQFPIAIIKKLGKQLLQLRLKIVIPVL